MQNLRWGKRCYRFFWPPTGVVPLWCLLIHQTGQRVEKGGMWSWAQDSRWLEGGSISHHIISLLGSNDDVARGAAGDVAAWCWQDTPHHHSRKERDTALSWWRLGGGYYVACWFSKCWQLLKEKKKKKLDLLILLTTLFLNGQLWIMGSAQ